VAPPAHQTGRHGDDLTSANIEGNPMKKIINQPDRFVDEMIEGILLAHPDQVRTPGDDRRILVRADAPAEGKVGIVTGGGSGHLPLFKGYVGQGLCSGVAIGNVFSSPSSQQVFEATKAVSGGAGVLYLYGNYGGDVFNFDLAADLAELEDIPTRTVLGRDDVASQPAERKHERRGVAGIFFAYKAAGAAAERGDSLEEVAAVAEDVVEHTATMGIGLSPTILPTTGAPSFDLPDGEMEIGIGIHGEPGIHRGPLETADEITERIVDALAADLSLAAGDRVAVLVNGLGATPLEELYVVYRRVHQLLGARDVTIARSYVGEYATSLEMAGLSISLLTLDDARLELLDAPAASPFFQE
jgi:phosphoenolpyruvate---glycerone phosphotransferase subunit DhaK